MSVIIYAAIPLFFLTIAIEAMWAKRRLAESADVLGYRGVDTLASLSMGLGNVIIAAFTKLVLAALLGLGTDLEVANRIEARAHQLYAPDRSQLGLRRDSSGDALAKVLQRARPLRARARERAQRLHDRAVGDELGRKSYRASIGGGALGKVESR